MTIQNRVKRSFLTRQMDAVELKHQVQGHSYKDVIFYF